MKRSTPMNTNTNARPIPPASRIDIAPPHSGPFTSPRAVLVSAAAHLPRPGRTPDTPRALEEAVRQPEDRRRQPNAGILELWHEFRTDPRRLDPADHLAAFKGFLLK